MTDLAEFDDITGEPYYRQSKKARAAMIALASQHGLVFTHNPGGGEWYRPDPSLWTCQIGTYDDIDDLYTLRRALAKSPLSPDTHSEGR